MADYGDVGNYTVTVDGVKVDQKVDSGEMTILATTTGDVDGDGDDEIFTALVDSARTIWIYRNDTNDSIGSPIDKVVGGGWAVSAFAAGDVDGDGRDELFTALSDSVGRAFIYRSDTGNGLGSVIYTSLRPRAWTVQALAVGDVNGDGDDELFSAFEHANGDARIYRAESGNGIGARIYKSRVPGTWTVQALAVGDVNGDGDDELFSAFEHANGDARIYRSDSGNGIGRRIYKSRVPGTWTVQALAVGDVDGDGDDELFSAFEHANGDARIYHSDSGNGIGRRIYKSRVPGTWTVNAMTIGDVDNDGADELFTTLQRSNGDKYLYRSDDGNSIGRKIDSSGSYQHRARDIQLPVDNVNNSQVDGLFRLLKRSTGLSFLSLV